jgi:DNA-binding IclR family transcriptional regulator
MPKARSTNRKAGRMLDVLEILRKEHALSLVELAVHMEMHPRSIRRYVQELLLEKKIFKRYRLTLEGGSKPNYYYSIKRKP